MNNTHQPETKSSQYMCSIVIRAYNEQEHIGRLLKGITQQTIKDIEVILVDSGSTDNTISIAREYAPYFSLQVVNIRPDEFTFGRSLNLGISQSQADLIAIASAHVYPVYPDWLENLLAPFSDTSVALSYGKQRGDASTKFSEQQIFARWYPDHSIARQDHPFCNNANAAIRRELWKIHPYDETLSGLEDLAWAHWALEQGKSISYVSEADVIHVHNEVPHNVYNRYRREAMAFKRVFPNQHFRMWDFFRLVSTNIASDLWHAGRQKVLSNHLRSIFWFRWMQFLGTYHGHREAGPLTWRLRQTFYYPQGIKNQNPETSRTVEPIRYND